MRARNTWNHLQGKRIDTLARQKAQSIVGVAQAHHAQNHCAILHVLDFDGFWLVHFEHDVRAQGPFFVADFGPGLVVGLVGKVRAKAGVMLDQYRQAEGAQFLYGLRCGGDPRLASQDFNWYANFHSVLLWFRLDGVRIGAARARITNCNLPDGCCTKPLPWKRMVPNRS